MTEINSKTKIAKIIKKNPDALEALIAVTPKFDKLRNPLLRKLLAGRTSIAQAAKVGGCDLKEIVAALEPLGFEYKEDGKKEKETKNTIPDFVENLDESTCEVLDVREDLATGKDPLKKIMAVVKNLPSDKVLKLVNTFEPTPLINLLERKGYESYIKEGPGDEVHAFFKLKSESEKKEINPDVPDTVSEDVFMKKLSEFEERVTPVDVSMMSMPMPMVTILEALSDLPVYFVLSVQHKRIPVFLFSELKERNFDYLVYQAGEDDVKLLIFHKKEIA